MRSGDGAHPSPHGAGAPPATGSERDPCSAIHGHRSVRPGHERRRPIARPRSIAVSVGTGGPGTGATAPSRTKPVHLTVGPPWPQDDLTLRPARLHSPARTDRTTCRQPSPCRASTTLEAHSELPVRRALVPGLAFLAIGLVAGDIVQLAGYAPLRCRPLPRAARPPTGRAQHGAPRCRAARGLRCGPDRGVPRAPGGRERRRCRSPRSSRRAPTRSAPCCAWGWWAHSRTRRGVGTPSDGSCACSPAPSMVMLVADLAPAGGRAARCRGGRVVDRLDARPGPRRSGRGRPRPGPRPRPTAARDRPILAASGAEREAPARPAGRSPPHPRRRRCRGDPGAARCRRRSWCSGRWPPSPSSPCVPAACSGAWRRLADALAHQTTHDPLTGIANRTLFSRRLTDVLTDGRQCSVVLIDLDEFKQVNDELGHLAGDALLVEAASRLTRAVRVDDLVARFAGDEFAVLLPDITPDEAQRVIERAAELLNTDVVVAGHQMSLRASIGLAHWQASTPGSVPALDQSSDDAAHLLAAADQDMYRDKRQRARHLVLVRSTELVASTPAPLPALGADGGHPGRRRRRRSSPLRRVRRPRRALTAALARCRHLGQRGARWVPCEPWQSSAATRSSKRPTS